MLNTDMEAINWFKQIYKRHRHNEPSYPPLDKLMALCSIRQFAMYWADSSCFSNHAAVVDSFVLTSSLEMEFKKYIDAKFMLINRDAVVLWLDYLIMQTTAVL